MSLRTPPLHAVHEDRGASFTDFGGWEMPVEFDSITKEHAAVRESAGIFDVSHMGEIRVEGPDAGTLTDRLVTNDVVRRDEGDAAYAAVTDEEGVMLDDAVVYRQPGDRPTYLVVVNAGHDAEMTDRWEAARERWGLDASVGNRTDDLAMFALQGPEAVDLAVEAADPTSAVRDLSWFEATHADVAGVPTWVARTGYTGEDGVELICPADGAEAVWTAFEVQPCGLGARDTLRLEAGLLLSGQDFDPEENPRTPYEAGIGFAVDLDTDFLGRDALARVHDDGPAEKLVGLTLDERGVPRHGYPIETPDGEEVGTVTSGTMSPTLGEPIAVGYVPVKHGDPGTSLRVQIRDDPKKATVRGLPFLPEET